jgi:hypothetical protein
MRPFTFFVWNMLIAYIISLGICLVLYDICLSYNTGTISEKVINEGAQALFRTASIYLLGYLALILVTLFLSALISFLILRILSSDVKLATHVGIFLDLTALETFAAIAVTLLWIFGGSSVLLIIMFAFARLWYLLAGFVAIKEAYDFNKAQSVVAFFLGFLPGALFLNIIVVGFYGILLCWSFYEWP